MAIPSGFTYSTTEFIKFTLGADFNTDDEDIWRIHKNASTLVTGYTGRIFVPYLHTMRCNESHIYDFKTLHLRNDLLAATLVTNGDGAVIDETDYTLLPEDTDPKCSVELDADDWTFPTLQSRATIVGIFGYSDNYAKAWGVSGDAIKTEVTEAVEAVIEVNDVDGLDDRYETRFEIGDYLLVSTDDGDEIMQVRDIDVDDNTLTVIRGANGTTPLATIAAATEIFVWRQNEDVKWATTHIAVWLYKNKDTVNQVFTVPGGEERVGGIAKEVWERLDKFKYEMRRES